MRLRTLVAAAVFGSALSLSTFAQYYVAGDFNGWDPAGSLMTETSAGSGIWQVSLTGLTASSRHEFKVTPGAWNGSEFPSANSWFYADASGNVTLTYDLNAHSDGWNNTSQRVGVSFDPGAWTAVGDWQGWDNANATTAMMSLGGGIYEYQQIIAPGNYMFKAVATGSWDAIGSDARSINAGNLNFSTTPTAQLAIFRVDAMNGTIQVSVIPEPATVSLMGFAGLALAAWMRKRA